MIKNVKVFYFLSREDFMLKSIAAVTIIAMNISTAFAETIEFPVGQDTGAFNCTASDKNAKVSMDTDSVTANGFCTGSEYVTQDGHIQGMPASILNEHYFQIEKSLVKAGSVHVLVSSGNVSCSMGQGDKSRVYGDGRFCLRKR